MTTLSIQLNDEIARELDDLARFTKRGREEIASTAVLDFLTMLKSSFASGMTQADLKELQQQMAPYFAGKDEISEEEFLEQK